MSWELLPTDYTDRTWNGQQRFNEIDNGDGTVSFLDVTVYTNKEKSFFGAKDANRMNEALNTLMGMVENGTDLYESFQNYFETQKKLFETKSDRELTDFTEYQHRTFTTWFNTIKGQLSTDQAGHLQNQLDALKEKHDKDIDSVTKKLITLTVTTDDDELIGDNVRVTKGGMTLEQTFGASKALAFHLPELGTWTVTNTNPDNSWSSEVTCEMY